MNRTASWIAEAVGGKLIGANVLVSGIAQTDSRECNAGDLFIARVGENSDGHAYVSVAVQNGAVCAIVEHEKADVAVPQIIVEDSTRALGTLAKAYLSYLRTLGDIEVLGITGSAGKTTTKDLLGQMLGRQAPCVYPVLSFNNEVGCPLTILRADETTRYLVLEMGASGPEHLRYLTSIAPLDVGAVLMVGAAHLGGFGSLEALASAKRELVEGLVAKGTAVLNADDPQVLAMAASAPGPVAYFSTIDEPANMPAQSMGVWADSIELDSQGEPSMRVNVRVGGTVSTSNVHVHLVGLHQCTNALAAITMALCVGLSLDEAAEVLCSAQRLSPHRMVVHSARNIEGVEDVVVVDDSYNANPDSMRAGLETAKRIAQDRHFVAVLGEMLELGDESASLHAEVGRLVNDLGVNDLIAVGGQAEAVIKGAAGVSSHAVSTYQEAQEVLPQVMRDHSAVFLKGSAGSNVWRIADALNAEVVQ